MRDDIAAGNLAFDILRQRHPHRMCKKSLLVQNHEQRIERSNQQRPRLVGTIGYHHLSFRKGLEARSGMESGAPGQLSIDGIMYAHFFANPNTGKPIGGVRFKIG